MTREELYRQAWERPMNALASELGVSGSYLARVFDEMNIPRPPRGYWAKLAVGRASPRPALAPARPGDPVEWTPGKAPIARMPRLSNLKPAPHAGRPRSRRPQTPALLGGAKAHFEKSRTSKKEGGYLRPYKRVLVDIRTSRACLDSALSLADRLFKALGAAGHRVLLAPNGAQLRCPDIEVREAPKPRNHHDRDRGWSPDRPTIAYVGEVAIGLCLVETSAEVDVRYVGGRFMREAEYRKSHPFGVIDNRFSWKTTRELPTGRLKVVAYSPYWRVDWMASWTQERGNALRPRIGEIVAAIESAARDLVPRLEEAERQAEAERLEREAAEARRRRAEDARRVAEAEQESSEQLSGIITTWARRMDVERFVEGISSAAAALPETERLAVLERLARARDFLGSTDPLDAFMEWRSPAERYRSAYEPDL